MNQTNNRVDTRLAELQRENRKGLFPYLTAGLPDPDTCAELICQLASLGVAGIELGFPFSDSIADGPVIQDAFARALRSGINTEAIFKMVGQVRRQVDIPLIAMVSFSIVYRIGTDKFISRAKAAGFDAFIIPDLSLEEAPEISKKILSAGMRLAMLVAPTTDPERQKRIAQLASGFIYYMSIAGITGERDQLPPELPANVRKLKELSGKPVLVGFGIKSAQQVKQVCSVAEGAIVGSAIVRRINQAIEENLPAQQITEQIVHYTKELLQGTT